MRALTLALLIGCGDKDSDDTGGVIGNDTGPDTEVFDADGDGFVAETGDCDDTDAGINPDAAEVCDGQDNDCDGDIDADDSSLTDGVVVYADADGDGYGAGDAVTACEVASGWSETDGDCDDDSADISPDATEVCDADDVDEDCDGSADDADDSVALDGAGTFYVDADGDGFGDPEQPATRCDAGSGYVEDDTDCNDSDAAVNPADCCWNGDWSGTLLASVDAGDFGLQVCSGEVAVHIDQTGSPQLVGSGSCTMSLLGTLKIAVTGDIDDADQVTGTLDVGGIIATDWTGSVSGSGLIGSTSGKGSYSGITFSYVIEIDLQPE